MLGEETGWRLQSQYILAGYVSIVDTVAAVAALAVTLSASKLIFILRPMHYKLLIQLSCLLDTCSISYMRTFPLKIHYKAVEILPVGWPWYEAKPLYQTVSLTKCWVVSYE